MSLDQSLCEFPDYDYLIKLIIVGDSSCGKSCLLLRFSDNTYQHGHIATIGVDFRIRTITMDDGQKAKLHIWDSAGQERFRTIISSYYRGAHGIIIVYDITNKLSFMHVQQWIKEIQKYTADTAACLLVGNKTDQSAQRRVSVEEGQAFADELQIPFIETSAQSGENVEQAFQIISQQVKQTLTRIKSCQTKINLSQNKNTSNTYPCCL